MIGDAQIGGHFLSSEEAADQFGLREDEAGAWAASLSSLTCIWGSLLDPTPQPLALGEWVGYFLTANLTMQRQAFLYLWSNIVKVAGL